jgi:hypothetical protein
VKRSRNRGFSEASQQIDPAGEQSDHSTSPSRKGSSQLPLQNHAKPEAAESSPSVALGDQSYAESRLRKFNAIISKPFVDLNALEQVGASTLPILPSSAYITGASQCSHVFCGTCLKWFAVDDAWANPAIL